jgi:hypothetical protein
MVRPTGIQWMNLNWEVGICEAWQGETNRLICVVILRNILVLFHRGLMKGLGQVGREGVEGDDERDGGIGNGL